MRSKPLLFDVAALKARVGDRTFTRGEKYHRDGHVDIFAVEDKRVLAQVHGSETYHVELTSKGKRIGGACSCPAFDDSGFCKHMIATALAVNAGEGAEGAGAIARVRKYLQGQGVDALVELIVGVAERDAALWRRLDEASTVATLKQGDAKAIESRLRKLIDNATRTGEFVDFRAVKGWDTGVREALDAVADAAAGRPDIMLKLMAHAIDRIEKATGHIDDSDGYCTGLLEYAGDIHLTAAVAARPEPTAFARDLFARETASEFDTYGNAVERYADVLGAAGLDEYRRLAQEQWGRQNAMAAKARKELQWAPERRRVMATLDFFAERDGDVDARIALRAIDLEGAHSYVQLVEFCVSQRRTEAALHWAEKGLRASAANATDERLVSLMSQLLAKEGRKQDADTSFQCAFERSPSFPLYESWHKLSGRSACDRAIAFLESQIAAGGRRGQVHIEPALLTHILMKERRFDEAWILVGRHELRSFKQELAAKTEKTHKSEALGAYAERVDELVGIGGNERYAEAMKLVERMAKLQSGDERKAYVAALRVRHERKRNFMKLLR